MMLILEYKYYKTNSCDTNKNIVSKVIHYIFVSVNFSKINYLVRIINSITNIINTVYKKETLPKICYQFHYSILKEKIFYERTDHKNAIMYNIKYTRWNLFIRMRKRLIAKYKGVLSRGYII